MSDLNTESEEAFGERFRAAQRLYASRRFTDAVPALDALLSEAAEADGGGVEPADLHLLLAKCHRGLGNTRAAILACNSALEQRPKWKDPFLYRSACFQSLHASFLESAGANGDRDVDVADHVERDRREADLIVDASLTEDRVNDADAGPSYVRRLDTALHLARDGHKIFVECGQYDVSSSGSDSSSPSPAPFFLRDKNVSLIGASVKDTVLEYGLPSNAASLLNTFLICVDNTAHSPTLLKRLTFRNLNPGGQTKFLGVAGGTVQLEDCVFDGGECTRVDALYANAKICGPLASRYPPPSILARFCVFDHCQGHAGVHAARACVRLNCCYFLGSRLAASDSAKITVEHCEFAQTGERSEQTVSCSGSDLVVDGCYVHGVQTSLLHPRSAQAVAATGRSVVKVSRCYLYKTGNGVHCLDSDLVCSQNLILSCSKRYAEFDLQQLTSAATAAGQGGSARLRDDTLGLYTGISVKRKAKIQLVDNHVGRCDVAVYVGDGAMPTVRGNTIEASFFTGVFAECHARPNVMNNVFRGRAPALAAAASGSNTPEGALGMLLILDSGGLIGRNTFECFTLSPMMVFASCHPTLKDNSFEDISIDRQRQEEMEGKMRELFCAELFKNDTYFYIVDSETCEHELRDKILNKKEPK